MQEKKMKRKAIREEDKCTISKFGYFPEIVLSNNKEDKRK